MNQYEVKFKVSGRPFRCKVSAESREDAEELIREAVVITEIQLLTGEEPKPEYRNAADDFAGMGQHKNIMDMLGMK
jgi:hypothetical protein